MMEYIGWLIVHQKVKDEEMPDNIKEISYGAIYKNKLDPELHKLL